MSEEDLTAAWMHGFHKRDDEVRVLKETILKLAGALEFYADSRNYPNDLSQISLIETDDGNKARAALAEVPEELRGK